MPKKHRSTKAAHSVSLSTLDLNLLRVFDAVTHERSVARASDRLGQTSSAVSHALSRLRYALNDELFVRSREGMQLTPRAAEMAPQLRQLLLQLQLILTPSAFSPSQTDRLFTISCGPYAGSVLLPKFVARLRAEAPRSQLRIRWDDSELVDELSAGRIDLAIGHFGRIPPSLEREYLFDDTMVWVVSAASVARRRRLTLKELVQFPHVIATSTGDAPKRGDEHYIARSGLQFSIDANDGGALDRALAEGGLQRNIGLIVPSSLLAWTLVPGTDLAALVTRRQAQTLPAQNGLRFFDPPYPSPPLRMQALWHREFGSQPALAWFRNVLKEVAAQL